MAEVVTNELMYELMKRMNAEQVEIRSELREIRHRVALTELHMTGVQAGIQMLNDRVDRIQDDMRLVKRRLDLVDA